MTTEISVVIPFADPHEQRTKVLNWAKAYWEHHLEAEYIVQKGPEVEFSKTKTLNEGIAKASGSIIVAMDADVIFEPQRMNEAIQIASRADPAWVMPYGKMRRLSESDTDGIVAYVPKEFVVSRQIVPERVREQVRAVHFGAACQIYPKAAWEMLEGFDERFCGWGSEDECMKLSLDTIWAPSHILDGDLYHLEHVRIGKNFDGVGNGVNRKWNGQTERLPNMDLRNEYARAAGDKTAMEAVLAQAKTFEPQ